MSRPPRRATGTRWRVSRSSCSPAGGRSSARARRPRRRRTRTRRRRRSTTSSRRSPRHSTPSSRAASPSAPDERHPTCAAFVSDLRAALATPSLDGRLRSSPRRRVRTRAPFAPAYARVAAGCCVLAGALGLLAARRRARVGAERARRRSGSATVVLTQTVEGQEQHRRRHRDCGRRDRRAHGDGRDGRRAQPQPAARPRAGALSTTAASGCCRRMTCRARFPCSSRRSRLCGHLLHHRGVRVVQPRGGAVRARALRRRRRPARPLRADPGPAEGDRPAPQAGREALRARLTGRQCRTEVRHRAIRPYCKLTLT